MSFTIGEWKDISAAIQSAATVVSVTRGKG